MANGAIAFDAAAAGVAQNTLIEQSGMWPPRLRQMKQIQSQKLARDLGNFGIPLEMADDLTLRLKGWITSLMVCAVDWVTLVHPVARHKKFRMCIQSKYREKHHQMPHLSLLAHPLNATCVKINRRAKM